MPKCIILVGVPGAGKSTWLANKEALIASSDHFIDQIAAEKNSTYNAVFKDAAPIADRKFWQLVDSYACCGDNFYVDRTNMSAKSRKRIIDAVLKINPKYDFEAVVFLTPEPKEHQRRLDSRPGKSIPIAVLDSMSKNFVMPTEDEGFSKVSVV